MKTLVIFYSLEGNTKFISGVIAKELHADILEIKVKKEYPTSGLKKYIWGGKSVVFKEQPKIINENIDLSTYDNIVIGSPIWAGTYAAPFNTFVKEYKFTGKKVALFACHAGGGGEKCFKLFKEKLSGNNFINDITFVNPLVNEQESSKIAAQWAKSLMF